MIPFRPITNNVNRDRRYFIDGQHFVKMDENHGRGRHEADVLEIISDAWYAPTIIASWIREPADGDPAYHCIRMTRKPGDTLENLKASLEPRDRRAVVELLLGAVLDMLKRGIIHGDLNESNVLFCRDTYTLSIIDWETATMGEELTDIYGPQWGLIDLLGRLK